MDATGMAATSEDRLNHGGEEKIRSKDELSGQEKGKALGSVHVLWLLVVLSAFVFGATLVNIAVGMRICETSRKQSAALETLTLSVREVQKTVLHLSKVIEETLQAEEDYDREAPSEGGRI
ncbi:MAG: hypothetical protein R6X07_12595 [Desulfatiglandales bacterium]